MPLRPILQRQRRSQRTKEARLLRPRRRSLGPPAACPTIGRRYPNPRARSTRRALIEEKRFGEADALWGDAAAAKRQTAELKRFSEAHLQIGKPHDMEGAAGSIYITVPVVLYGTREGKNVHRGGDMILRRVNDVPGSTEAQRRWHIERVAWSAA